MGVYRSTPLRDKHTDRGQSATGRIKYAAAEMQGKFLHLRSRLKTLLGWRMTMEDAHIFVTDVEKDDIHVFGVFDGHGGNPETSWHRS